MKMTTRMSIIRANTATVESVTKARKHLATIEAELTRLMSTGLRIEGNWTHAGSAGHLEAELSELANFVTGK